MTHEDAVILIGFVGLIGGAIWSSIIVATRVLREIRDRIGG